jgi:myo-inositol-1-phosphate synthase
MISNARIKLLSIASYNNGRNLSAKKLFRSKEVGNNSIVDDVIDANRLLHKPKAEGEKGERPNHLVVIK